MTANGAAERLERLTEMKRQAPDSHGIYTDPAQQGVTVAWLAQVFELDQTAVKKKLRFWGFFFASLMLTPVFGLLLLIIAAPAEGCEALQR